MRVLHLVGQDADHGGILSVVRNLQEASANLGWSHVVWVNRAYHETRRPALTYAYSQGICAESPHPPRLLAGAVRSWFDARKLLKREAFEVVHAHARGTLLVAIAIAAWMRRPVVFTNHAYARRVGLYRWAARRPRMRTVLLTPNMARHYGIAETATRVRIISACCADSFFEQPLTARPEPEKDGQIIRLVGVGSIVRWKNWHLVLHALTQLEACERRRLEFRHWGPTPPDDDAPGYESELRAYVQRHHLEGQVRFGGPSQSIAECVRAADWFVLPSTNEPCSVALIEALASGVPALVSASGGNVDIVEPGRTGLLFAPGDAADLATKLRSLLARQVHPLAPAAIRETVRHRSASRVVAEYARVYEQARHATGVAAARGGAGV